jgi:hypothetical protein
MNNPFYRKPFTDMRANVAKDGLDFKTRSQWCSGCHEPALMLAGRGRQGFRPGGSERAGRAHLPRRATRSTRCHNRTGNGAYNIRDDVATALPLRRDERGASCARSAT